MAAAEVDGYRAGSYAKYSVEQRAAMRDAFYGARSAVFWHLFLLNVPWDRFPRQARDTHTHIYEESSEQQRVRVLCVDNNALCIYANAVVCIIYILHIIAYYI